jgi:hypothetical protein
VGLRHLIPNYRGEMDCLHCRFGGITAGCNSESEFGPDKIIISTIIRIW